MALPLGYGKIEKELKEYFEGELDKRVNEIKQETDKIESQLIEVEHLIEKATKEKA